MRKPLYKVGDKVVVFRRARYWWCSSMDHLIGKTFRVREVITQGYETTAYIVDTLFVSADCLRKLK